MTKLTYVDRPELSEVYADSLCYARLDGRNLRLEFAVERPELASVPSAQPIEPAKVVPVARLIVPIECLIDMQNQFATLIKHLVAQGVLKDFGAAHATKQ